MGVVIGSRVFLGPAPCQDSRRETLERLERLGIKALILPVEATANGAVQSIADAGLYAKYFKHHRDQIDGLVICLSNFGDEIAIAELVQAAPSARLRRARWPLPIWAIRCRLTPHRPGGLSRAYPSRRSSRRCVRCGTPAVARARMRV